MSNEEDELLRPIIEQRSKETDKIEETTLEELFPKAKEE